MKRLSYGLLLVLFLLSLACSGKSLNVSVPPASPPGPTTPALKENQFRGLLVKSDGKTGDFTFEVDGKEKTYPRTDDFKAYVYADNPKPTAPFIANDYLMRDMLVTLEKKDGKEYVVEMRGEKSKPSKKGTKIDGKFRGQDYNKKPDGVLILEANGKKTEYPLAKRTRYFDSSGNAIVTDMTRAFLNADVTIILDKEDGVDKVIEVWSK
jgi:hypothetical protein